MDNRFIPWVIELERRETLSTASVSIPVPHLPFDPASVSGIHVAHGAAQFVPAAQVFPAFQHGDPQSPYLNFQNQQLPQSAIDQVFLQAFAHEPVNANPKNEAFFFTATGDASFELSGGSVNDLQNNGLLALCSHQSGTRTPQSTGGQSANGAQAQWQNHEKLAKEVATYIAGSVSKRGVSPGPTH